MIDFNRRKNIDENMSFIPRDEIAVEDFGDSSLLFFCEQRRMLKLNHSSKKVFELLDGEKNLNQIFVEYDSIFKVGSALAKDDVTAVINFLLYEGAISNSKDEILMNGENFNDELCVYQASPNISLRESSNGAILFDIDSKILVHLNQMGLSIWNLLKAFPSNKQKLIECVEVGFKNESREKIRKDVGVFLAKLEKMSLIKNVCGERKSAKSDYHVVVENKKKLVNSMNKASTLSQKDQRVQGIFVHASSVKVAEGAVLFLGHSTSGKSTISQMLSECFPIIADDKLWLFKDRAGDWFVRALDMKVLKDQKLQYKLERSAVPLKALIRIFKSKNNSLKHAPQEETCKSLMDSVFEINFQRKKNALKNRKHWFKIAAEITREIEGWVLTFNKDTSSIAAIRKLIEERTI